MDNLHWTWGLLDNDSGWYIKVLDLDTDRYAVAKYELDDDSPLRVYETRDPELLNIVLNMDSDLFNQCRSKKNELIDIGKIFENATIANFM
jgi:hypothetical protein